MIDANFLEHICGKVAVGLILRGAEIQEFFFECSSQKQPCLKVFPEVYIYNDEK